MSDRKYIFTIFIILTISILLFMGCGDGGTTVIPEPTAGSNVSTISGLVYSSAGELLDGARVILTPLINSSENYGEVQEYVTQNGGQYIFTVKYGGNYLIEVRQRETLLDSRQFTVNPGENLAVNFGEPVSTASLTVYVWQDEDHTIPASNFTAELTPAIVNTSEITDSETSYGEGWVKFGNFSTGDYVLTISYEEIDEEKSILLSAGDNTEDIVLYRWHQQTIDGVSEFNSIYFTDSMNGWAVGAFYVPGINNYGGAVFRTTDGGKTWENSIVLDFWSDLNDVYFSDPQTGWAVGYKKTGDLSGYLYEGILMRTTDGGETWSEPQLITGSSHLQSVYFLDSQTGWLAGAVGPVGYIEGIIIKTTDGGQTWGDPLIVEDTNILHSICFTDEQTGWLSGIYLCPSGTIGSRGLVVKTIDGGETWSRLPTLEPPFEAGCFVDNLHGWAATQYGPVRTLDGGETWEVPSVFPGELYLYGIYFIDNMNGWAVGMGGNVKGLIIKTTDGGIHWSIPESITSTDRLFTVYFIDEKTGWACGGNGCITTYAPLVY